MRKEDKVMFRGCSKALRKEIIKSYHTQRISHAESDKGKK